MLISTLIPDDACTPGQAAWFVKCLIEGLALGGAPLWGQWQLPPLYESGIKFALPPEHGSGSELFLLPPDTYKNGWGDCDRLCIYRLTELVASGRKAGCRAEWIGDDLHVYIRHGDGKTEDPTTLVPRVTL